MKTIKKKAWALVSTDDFEIDGYYYSMKEESYPISTIFLSKKAALDFYDKNSDFDYDYIIPITITYTI